VKLTKLKNFPIKLHKLANQSNTLCIRHEYSRQSFTPLLSDELRKVFNKKRRATFAKANITLR
jgi:hypothetical protein